MQVIKFVVKEFIIWHYTISDLKDSRIVFLYICSQQVLFIHLEELQNGHSNLTEVDRIIFLDYYIFDDVNVILKAYSTRRNKVLKVTRLIAGVSTYQSDYSNQNSYWATNITKIYIIELYRQVFHNYLGFYAYKIRRLNINK